MGTATVGARVRRRAAKSRHRRRESHRGPGRHIPSAPKLRTADRRTYRKPHGRTRRKVHGHARWQARRRHFMVRRLALLVVLCCSLGLIWWVTPATGLSSEPEDVSHVAPVEVGASPELPNPPPDLSEVWSAAEAGDRSPDLATSGKLATAGGKIALTFDDGPDPRVTPAILDTLKERHVEATFFVVGSQVKKNPGLLRRIVNEGHTIGNHTYDHADMSDLSPGQMRTEIQKTQKAVDDALGYHYQMALMRPPYGEPYFRGSDALPRFRRVVRQEQIFPTTWTIDSQDYQLGGDPEGIVNNVIGQDEAGRRQDRDEVILLHDVHLQDVQALPGIIDHYEDSGRKFVRVDELLRDKYLDP